MQIHVNVLITYRFVYGIAILPIRKMPGKSMLIFTDWDWTGYFPFPSFANYRVENVLLSVRFYLLRQVIIINVVKTA